jgi:hypothetical protein
VLAGFVELDPPPELELAPVGTTGTATGSGASFLSTVSSSAVDDATVACAAGSTEPGTASRRNSGLAGDSDAVHPAAGNTHTARNTQSARVIASL